MLPFQNLYWFIYEQNDDYIKKAVEDDADCIHYNDSSKSKFRTESYLYFPRISIQRN
jgi:hypothetical protein